MLIRSSPIPFVFEMTLYVSEELVKKKKRLRTISSLESENYISGEALLKECHPL